MNKFSAITLLFICATSVLFAQTEPLLKSIERTFANKKATVGVAACRVNGKDGISFNGDDRFPMQSVFKFHVALSVLDQVDKDRLSLNRKVDITKAALLPDTWSPIREKYPEGNIQLTVAELLAYTVAQSDNNGCDILLKLIGGTKTVERYLNMNGIVDVEIKANECEMQKNWDTQFLNWTTPVSAVVLLCQFYNGKILSPESKKVLYNIMENTVTGDKRIKGLLPKGTKVAHKTGTSGTNKAGITSAVNDIGIVTLPDGSAYAIAVFVTNSKENNATNEAIIAEISKLVWNYYAGGNL